MHFENPKFWKKVSRPNRSSTKQSEFFVIYPTWNQFVSISFNKSKSNLQTNIPGHLHPQNSVEKPIQPTSDDITGMFSPVRKNEDVIHALLPVLNTQEPFLVQKFRGILGGIPLRLTTIWSNPVAIICPEKNMLLFLSVDQGVDTTFLLPTLAWIWPKWFNDSIGYESEMSTIAIW